MIAMIVFIARCQRLTREDIETISAEPEDLHAHEIL